MISERQATNPVARKPPRPRVCELCLHRSAYWYCPADDAFLCHACDASVHSANQVAHKHERVSVSTSGISDNVVQGATARPVWLGGFKRKSRTPRIRCVKEPLLSVQSQDKKDERRELECSRPEPRVPEIGDEGVSFRTEKNDEDVNSLVPDFHASREAGLFVTCDDVDDCLSLHTQLAGISADIESLLEVEELEKKTSHIDIEETRVEFNFEDENDALDALERYFKEEGKTEEGQLMMGINWKSDHGQSLMGCEKEDDKVLLATRKTEENVECETNARHSSMFLRLNYGDVIAAWNKHSSTWTIGSQSEFITSSYQLAAQGIGCPTEDKVGGVFEKKGSSCSERQARVWRYRDKRRTRLFKKKIRYEVRKLNAEKRPRIKGRFVRRTSLEGNPVK